MILKNFSKKSLLALTCGLAFLIPQDVFATTSVAPPINTSTQPAEPWMKSQIDSMIGEYKKKFPGDWTNDTNKISAMNGTTPKVLALLKQFETEKAPPFRQKIRDLVKDKDASYYITPDVGTGYRSHYIRCLWVKNEKGDTVSPNDAVSNSDDLKLLGIYGTDDASARTPKVAFFTDKSGKSLFAFEEFYKESADSAVQTQSNRKVDPKFQAGMDKIFKGFFTAENKYESPLKRVKEGKISYYMLSHTGSGHGTTSTHNILSYALLPHKDFKSISGNLTFKSIKATDDNINGPWKATYTDDKGKEWVFDVIMPLKATKESAPCPFSGYQIITNAKSYMDSKGGKYADFDSEETRWRPMAVDHPEWNDISENLPTFIKKEVNGNTCKCTYTTDGTKKIVVTSGKVDPMKNTLIK